MQREHRPSSDAASMRQSSLSFETGHVDLEVIEAIFDAAVNVFTEYSHQEAAKTALAVMTYQSVGGEQYTTVKNDFPGLSAKDRIKSEKALATLGKSSRKEKQPLQMFLLRSREHCRANNQQS